ncbi:hypothetical protein D1BOALGB6SA_3288 [Olavius sp. associated proteobacterium Delta 1]|nr:hypothetical protein D1BOALGB6SA_3288 [Olavius sp. associated proteobacterium Delta 1]
MLEYRAEYRDLVENANCIIFQMDTRGKITFFNRFAQDFFGYSEAEILGRSIVGTITPATDSTGRNLEIMIQDEALATKDFKQTHSLVHNLKGLAGNLAARDLQAAEQETEKLVRGDQKETPSKKQLDPKFMELEKTINQALEAVRLIGHPAAEKSIEPSTEWMAEIPVELVKEVTGRLKTAAEMGDVMKIQ